MNPSAKSFTGVVIFTGVVSVTLSFHPQEGRNEAGQLLRVGCHLQKAK